MLRASDTRHELNRHPCFRAGFIVRPALGIGLAVVQKAVDMQGGKVWLESTPGSGTTFHAECPQRRKKLTSYCFN